MGTYISFIVRGAFASYFKLDLSPAAFSSTYAHTLTHTLRCFSHSQFIHMWRRCGRYKLNNSGCFFWRASKVKSFNYDYSFVQKYLLIPVKLPVMIQQVITHTLICGSLLIFPIIFHLFGYLDKGINKTYFSFNTVNFLAL